MPAFDDFHQAFRSSGDPAREPLLSQASLAEATRDATILVIDDDQNHALLVADSLAAEGWRTEVAPSAEEGIRRLEERDFDLVVTELVLRDVPGMAVLDAARRKEPAVEAIVVTSRASVEQAVEAMSRGALIYLQKPVAMAELRAVARKALERVRIERHAVELEQLLDNRFGFESIVGNSPAMHKVFDVLRQAAPTSATVLILGESGTGKELVAKAIRQNSPRKNYPFVAVNCAALSEGILESELFGHEKGAFTGAMTQRKGRFEYAHKGTLFLDEIGDVPTPTQVKLLRVLEEREITRVGSNQPIKVDVRLVTATNQDLEDLVKAGKFRQDLYYRLKVITIRLPPLRERQGDVALLAERFLREFAIEHGKPVEGFDPEVRRLLGTYPWPGNVRELRNAIEHMVVIAKGLLITMEGIPETLVGAKMEAKSIDSLAGMSLEDVERELIRNTLVLTNGNREAAAKILDIGERTLYRKINKYGLRSN